MVDRKESVTLSLEGNFPTEMAEAAAMTALLKHELGDLSGHAIRSSRSIDGTERSTRKLGDTSQRTGTQLGRTESQIDKLSGRMRIYLDLAAGIGPAFVPIGAVAIPALTGLSAEMGFAVLGAGAVLGAFQGVGDALKAMNKAALEPTAENIAAARVEMNKIGPDAQAFVLHIRQLIPELKQLRDIAGAGVFPGLDAGISSLETAAPIIENLVAAVSTQMGHIFEDAGESLASPRWTEFYDFLTVNAPPAMEQLAQSTGNVAHAAAEMWMAFDPLNDDFGTWLLQQTEDLDDWATKLRQTNGAEELFDYIRETGPQVEETFGAIANAALQIVEATAPLGGPVLEGLETVADIIGAIADSNLGTPLFTAAAGMALLNRATSVWGSTSGKSFRTFARGKAELVTSIPPIRDFGNALLHSAHSQDQLNKYFATGAVRAMGARRSVLAWGRSVAPTAAGVAGLAAVSTGLSDELGVTNAVTLALAGSMVGPWGAAIGGSVGLLLDAKGAASGYEDALEGINKASRTGDLVQLNKDLDTFTKKSRDMYNHKGAKDLLGDIGSQIGTSFSGDLGASESRDEAKSNNTKKRIADLRVAFGSLGDSLGVFRSGVEYSMTDVDELSTQLIPTLDKLGVTTKDFLNMDSSELDVLAGRIQDYNTYADSAAGRTDVLEKALAGLDNNILSTADSADAFAAAIGGLLGPGLDAEASTDKYTTSVRELGKALRDNGGAFEGNSKAALGNREASRAWMASFSDMLVKQAQAGASSASIARQVGEARSAFIGEARAAGISEGAIRRRLRTMGLTPRLVRTVFNAAGLEVVSAKVSRLNAQYQRLPRRVRIAIRADGVPKTEADVNRLDKKVGGLTKQQRRIIARLMDQTPETQRKILRNLRKVDNAKANPKATLKDEISGKIPGIQHSIDSLHGKSVTVTTHHKTVKDNALGGFYTHDRSYALGGMDVANSHRPEYASTPGVVPRVWLEDETEGESYIPHANDYRRPGAIDVLKRTAALFGLDVVDWREQASSRARSYALGGFSGPQPRVSVAAPSVSLAGALTGAQIVAVFPGIGEVIGEVVDGRMADQDDMSGMRGRAGVN